MTQPESADETEALAQLWPRSPHVAQWACGRCGAMIAADLTETHVLWHREIEQSGPGFAQRVAAAQRALAMRNRFPMRPLGG